MNGPEVCDRSCAEVKKFSTDDTLLCVSDTSGRHMPTLSHWLSQLFCSSWTKLNQLGCWRLMKDSAAGLLNCLNLFQDEDFDCKDIRAHLLPATGGDQDLCIM
ncbi:hypothetical protein DPX16_4650 [Anabarilius grahami]|uniref:Uncharacterized protein n=1 Tax=Anabarilius grahami TaxID=495550 RepID=A0A3N0Y052_ANAGA|nr:hypothetical protein DPX16_4650 [Anabarilius grahami]